MKQQIHEIQLSGYGACADSGEERLDFGTDNSYGIEVLHLNPGDGWEGLEITATFHAPDGQVCRVWAEADGMVPVPQEATASGGVGKIVFAGISDGAQRCTTNLKYSVNWHASVDGKPAQPTTPGVVEQVLAKTAQDRAAAEEAARAAAQSESAAAQSESGALAAAGAAQDSAAAAAGSAQEAAVYVGEAGLKASEAAGSAADAGNSAAAAAQSAAAAAGSAGDARIQAEQAGASATAAALSEKNAADSARAAAASEAASRTAAEQAGAAAGQVINAQVEEKLTEMRQIDASVQKNKTDAQTAADTTVNAKNLAQQAQAGAEAAVVGANSGADAAKGYAEQAKDYANQAAAGAAAATYQYGYDADGYWSLIQTVSE